MQRSCLYSSDNLRLFTEGKNIKIFQVCVDSTYLVNNSELAIQISIYSYNLTFTLMLGINFSIVAGLVILFSMLICCSKLIIGYIFIAFGLLVGFSFYLLKTIKDRVDSLTVQYSTDSTLSNSQFIS